MTANHEGRSLRDGFLASTAAGPERIALTIRDRRWTYAEVDQIARRWATCLVNATPNHRPARVGVFGSRSETSYVGTLASLFAGATFVPLNPSFPVARTCEMLAQAEVDALLVGAEAVPQLEQIVAGLAVVPPILLTSSEAPPSLSVAFDRASMAAAAPLTRLPDVSSDSLAYLLFTSGSTGRPKGVPITHRNVLAFLDENQRRYGITPSDRLSQTFDQTFDLSIFDLFMAWQSGACVCSLQPIELLSPFEVIERHHISVWFSVPSVAALIHKQRLLTPGSLPSLRLSLFCGERLPRSIAEAWQRAAPSSIVENLYGPTELTIACSAYRWTGAESAAECVQDIVPIGRFYNGLSVLVVDADLQPVALGDAGELSVAGVQQFPGYWRAPELTAAQVFERRGAHGEVLRYYRTGDRVRVLPNGNYVHLGRVDSQVKIGGYRIELGEVEAALRNAGCIEAVVLPWPSSESPESLVAFISGSEQHPKALEASLRSRLPKYMIPRATHVVETMPLNASGKVDRRALRDRLATPHQRPNAAQPGASGTSASFE